MDDNPYASPRAFTEFIPSTEPRQLSLAAIAGVGAILGVAACFVSLALIPASVTSPGEHDLRLANHLGFIFPPLVGLWAAWCRRSMPWAVFGVLSGLLIGAIYYALCGYNFFAVMVAFPCLLGGVTSVVMGLKLDRGPLAFLSASARDWLPASFSGAFTWYYSMLWALLLSAGSPELPLTTSQ